MENKPSIGDTPSDQSIRMEQGIPAHASSSAPQREKLKVGEKTESEAIPKITQVVKFLSPREEVEKLAQLQKGHVLERVGNIEGNIAQTSTKTANLSQQAGVARKTPEKLPPPSITDHTPPRAIAQSAREYMPSESDALANYNSDEDDFQPFENLDVSDSDNEEEEPSYEPIQSIHSSELGGIPVLSDIFFAHQEVISPAQLAALCESGVFSEDQTKKIILGNLQNIIQNNDLINAIAQLPINETKIIHRQLLYIHQQLNKCGEYDQSMDNEQRLAEHAVDFKCLALIKFLLNNFQEYDLDEIIYTHARDVYNNEDEEELELEKFNNIVKLLINQGFNINKTIVIDRESHSMLGWAIKDNNLSLAIDLINLGAEYNLELLEQALLKALHFGSLSEVKQFINFATDDLNINATNERGVTILENASVNIYSLFSPVKEQDQSYLQRKEIGQKLIRSKTSAKKESLLFCMITCLVPESIKIIQEFIDSNTQMDAKQLSAALKTALMRPIYTQEEADLQKQIITVLIKGGAQLTSEDYKQLSEIIDSTQQMIKNSSPGTQMNGQGYIERTIGLIEWVKAELVKKQ